MKITTQRSDEAVLSELGIRIARLRLDLQLTQAALAEQAGVSKRTVERVEAGASVQLSNLVRILRALELLPRLDGLLPEAGPRPMELLKLKGKQRQRATARQRTTPPAKLWSWEDER